MQKWKTEPNLYNCPRDENNNKKLDYYDTYIKEFLSSDPLRDWESIERCKELWNFLLKKRKFRKKSLKILDAGTKDGQFTNWLNTKGHQCIGIDVDPNYINYAQSKNRNVVYGDICNIDWPANTFDVVFAHFVMGLSPDFKKSIEEMLRVVKVNGIVIFCNQIPGNPKKHYSLVKSVDELNKMLYTAQKHEKIYFDFWKGNDEHVAILKRC